MATTRVNGIEVYFDDLGDAGRPTVLLVSGLGAQCLVYDDEFCSLLVAAGYRVIRFDNRDVGLSTHLDGAPSDALAAVLAAAAGEPVEAAYTLSDMAADAVGLLDSLDVERVHVAGASMGGMIAQTIAIEHPARVESLTSIMSTTGEQHVGSPDPEVLGALMSIMTPQSTRAARIDNGVELARIIGTPEQFDEPRVRERTARFVDRAYDPAGTARQLIAITASGSRADGLTGLDLPTVVLHGDRDRLVDISGGRRTAELVPGAEFRTLGGMAHDLPPAYWGQLIGGVVDSAAAPR